MAEPFIHIEDYVGGTFSDTGAAGNVHFNIVHDSVGVTPTAATGYVPYGNIGAATLQSGISIRDRLQGLDPADYFDAAFIKNLPTGGVKAPVTQNITLDGSGQVIDLIVFTDSTGNPNYSARNTQFALACTDSSGDIVFYSKVTAIAETSREFAYLSVTDRLSNYPNNTAAEYRATYDTTDPAAGFKVQSMSGLTGTYTIWIHDLSPTVYGNDVTFNPTLNTPLGTEVIASSLNVRNWQVNNIVRGVNGGSVVDSIGDIDGTDAWIDFKTGEVDIHAKEVKVGRFSGHGARLSRGEYGTWAAPKTTEWPMDATYWTNLICQKRPDVVPPAIPDTSLNPSSTVTWTAVDGGSCR